MAEGLVNENLEEGTSDAYVTVTKVGTYLVLEAGNIKKTKTSRALKYLRYAVKVWRKSALKGHFKWFNGATH